MKASVTWHEAGDFLITYFGKISCIMHQNKKNLLKLYKAAIDELEQSLDRASRIHLYEVCLMLCLQMGY